MLRLLRLPATLAALLLLLTAVLHTQAVAPGNAAFQRTWERTDQPVASGAVARTWIWGPAAADNPVSEPYADSPGGSRTVQYFDKSRMELNDPTADPGSPFYVTNGLLVVELMSGRLQLGNDTFEQHQPAEVNVAGDPDDPLTYADLAPLRAAPAAADGSAITQRVDGAGGVSDDPSLASHGVTAADHVQVPGIDHQVASVFWTFLNATGPVWINGQLVSERLFEPWYYATGLPITEAYWANVKVGGTVRLVLVQCFERRCLTYTEGNPDGFVIEAGNVGQHYHEWRYVLIPGEEHGTATATATATSTSTATSTATEEPVTEYVFETYWGKPYVSLTPVELPVGVAVDANDHLWIVDTFNDRLLEFDEDGIFRQVVGSTGSGPGQFSKPRDAAFDDNGRIYVVDTDNNRVEVFESDGTFVKQWGSGGSGNGQFNLPSAIDIRDDLVYVTDTGNNRVELFNFDGMYLGFVGSTGSGDGQLLSPYWSVAGDQGFVYVSDSANNRVEEFRFGGFIKAFGSQGSGDGQFKIPWGIDIAPNGDIYVTDYDNHRVQRFNSDGAYLSQWGSRGAGFGQFEYPCGLAIDSHGNVYVADQANHRVQKFTADGTFLFDVYDARRATFSIPTDIDVDPAGNLLTVDGHDDLPTISRYTPDGTPLDAYGRDRQNATDHDVLRAIAVGPTGDLYVTDTFSNRIQHFSATWEFLGQWGTPGSGPGQFNGPTAIDIDADGRVYVADSGNDRIQIFDANGGFITQLGTSGSGDEQFDDPEGIAIDGERIYVTDYGNDRVQVYALDGSYLGHWGGTGSELGQLESPVGIAVAPDETVLVVDYGNSRVEIFSAEGEALGVFGSAGSGEGEFMVPWGIAVDGLGNVYVTEIGNERVQKFAPVH